MAKSRTSKKGLTKKELLDEAIAKAVGAGKEHHLESVDFSDPNRPLTCLETDFPILPINQISRIEGSSGATRKPIYQMSKWWARRNSSVFRSMLIAAATRAPNDSSEAAKLVWDSYYGNHQKNEAFQKLKVADIFMGGGTTIVEGSRLGMQMYGNDLNPVAWFVVKNEMAQVDPKEVQKLLDHIEAEVKPQIMPFYACDCPRGHKGKWTQRSTGKVMGEKFDPLALKPAERLGYTYEGPEIIYTFWAKHGPCQSTECGHRTPIMSSPVIAYKTLTVKAWTDRRCQKCRGMYDIELDDARMAPSALFVVSPEEKPFTVISNEGKYSCPHCKHKYHDQAAVMKGESVNLGLAKNKKVELRLLIHPDWLKGSASKGHSGQPFGGCATDDAELTQAWNEVRQKNLKHIEVRGKLPVEIRCPDTNYVFRSDTGTVPKKSTFICMESTCGKQWDVLEAIRATQKTGPLASYAVQGYCPECDTNGIPYSGRFFDIPRTNIIDKANLEWHERRNRDLEDYWPKAELSNGWKTHGWSIPSHGYTHYWKMFNDRQLYVNTLLLKSLMSCNSVDMSAKEYVLGAFQQYLRNQCIYCFWNIKADQLEPMFSNNNYHPKSLPIENCVFGHLGRGNWYSCVEGIMEGLQWQKNPWELVSSEIIMDQFPDLHLRQSGKSEKVFPNDSIGQAVIWQGSATDCSPIPDGTLDMVITDPPFGDIMQYAELGDFFYVWLRLALLNSYPDYFKGEHAPKALEAVANPYRQEDPNLFYQRILTECWSVAFRKLKPAGILAFTFHHSEDEPWVAVLESLFEAGFYLEATFPIRSDETKGEGQFGSQLIEYDIIHVCRKRIEDTKQISWAAMRKRILQDVKQLQELLEHHHDAGLAEADLQVIRRGKALEYYSKHYGKVFVEKGREFTVREALLGINQLLDDQRDTTIEPPPIEAEPYTRQFLRLFSDKRKIERDQMHKFLRGTGVSPAEFEQRGWCTEKGKVYYAVSPSELAKQWKGVNRSILSRDFDQSMFLVGACYPDSGITVQTTLDSINFKPHPATGRILDWMTRHGSDKDAKAAAIRAKQLYDRWTSSNKAKVEEAQRTLFDNLED